MERGGLPVYEPDEMQRPRQMNDQGSVKGV